jgi:crossover junction endodeoxyribonuclease RusA
MDRFRLHIQVLGVPVPKGSGKAIPHRFTGKPIYRPANPKTSDWQHTISMEVYRRMGESLPYTGAVEVQMIFFLPRPKSAPKRVIEPTTSRGDLDKLERAVLDAIVTGGGLRDDGQVIANSSRKAFAGGYRDPQGANGLPRAVVIVESAEPREAVTQATEVRL